MSKTSQRAKQLTADRIKIEQEGFYEGIHEYPFKWARHHMMNLYRRGYEAGRKEAKRIAILDHKLNDCNLELRND